MKKIILPILFALSLLAVSCESKLEIPQKGTVSTLEFYSSDADAEAALNNIYASFMSIASSGGIYNPELMILNYSSDDILAAGNNLDDHDDFRIFCEFRYPETNGILRTCYDRYVSCIYACNLVISNFTTENRNGEAPKWESSYTKACVEQARVMRAYVHMMMAIMWNRPAIIDRLLEPDELPVQAESQSQILKWVVAECEKAISSGVLPKRNGTADKNSTAIMTVGFAQFVAGKAAVFDNDMATARKYLGDLIASGNYALTPSEEYWTNFHIDGDGNAEKIFAPNYIYDPNLGWTNTMRSGWMVNDVLCWRSDKLASLPIVIPCAGWNGGAIQEDFAKKFLEHDGDSPRRKACFITEDEFLYELEWNSDKNDASLDEKKADPKRGIENTTGIFSHGPYFEWKKMSFAKPSRILTGGSDKYHGDNINAVSGGASNQTNFQVARYAEALLLYAEACIGSGDEAKGLAALNQVQQRAGSGKISSKLTFQDVMEEKQYEMWWEGCRFPDLVRWDNLGKVDMKAIYNTSWGGKGIHKEVPTVFDEFFMEGKPGYQKYHKLYTTYSTVKYNNFEDKYKYFPFPRDRKAVNKFKDVLGWEYLNVAEEGE